jgi:hypothetical protein
MLRSRLESLIFFMVLHCIIYSLDKIIDLTILYDLKEKFIRN